MHNHYRRRLCRLDLLNFLLLISLFPLTLSQSFIPTLDTLNRVCDKASEKNEQSLNDTTKIPIPFICHLNVSYVRNANCAVKVTETFILPYSVTNGLPTRPISRLSEQEVKSLEVHVISGAPDFKAEPKLQSETDQAKLYNIPTPKSETPIALQLRYTLTNGVNDFDNKCGLRFTPKKEEGIGPNKLTKEKNIVRYRLSDWNIDVEDSEFKYSTSNPAVRLLHGQMSDIFKNENGTLRARMGVISAGDLEEFLVFEMGVKICSGSYQCFDDPFPVTKIIFIVVGVIILIIFLMCIVFCRVRKKKSMGYSRRRPRNTQLPDEFNAEDNDTDPPSTR